MGFGTAYFNFCKWLKLKPQRCSDVPFSCCASCFCVWSENADYVELLQISGDEQVMSETELHEESLMVELLKEIVEQMVAESELPVVSFMKERTKRMAKHTGSF